MTGNTTFPGEKKYLVDAAKPYSISEDFWDTEKQRPITPDNPTVRLFDKHMELTNKARKLMANKNHDYRGGSGDPYANFRSAPQLGITPVQGILLRMNDKMMRVKTFDEKGELQVKDEGLEDALIDIINYAVLIGGLIQEEKHSDHANKSRPAHP
jgi:hypothetical protein